MTRMAQGIHFQGFRFDADSLSLWSGEQEIRLTPKAAAVLKMLVSRAGTPVTKDELCDCKKITVAVMSEA